MGEAALAAQLQMYRHLQQCSCYRCPQAVINWKWTAYCHKLLMVELAFFLLWFGSFNGFTILFQARFLLGLSSSRLTAPACLLLRRLSFSMLRPSLSSRACTAVLLPITLNEPAKCACMQSRTTTCR